MKLNPGFTVILHFPICSLRMSSVLVTFLIAVAVSLQASCWIPLPLGASSALPPPFPRCLVCTHLLFVSVWHYFFSVSCAYSLTHAHTPKHVLAQIAVVSFHTGRYLGGIGLHATSNPPAANNRPLVLVVHISFGKLKCWSSGGNTGPSFLVALSDRRDFWKRVVDVCANVTVKQLALGHSALARWTTGRPYVTL